MGTPIIRTFAPDSSIIRLGILGCGAITRVRHIPAALSHPDVTVGALVDANEQRAAFLKHMFGLNCRISSDYRTILPEVDAVIVALPNYLHVPVTVEALHAKVHVLCEKPLATDSAGVRKCSAAAEESGSVLAVVAPRRFYDSTVVLGILLEQEALGNLKGYDWEHGMPFAWQSATGFFFQQKLAGGGVLLDEGVHLLDNLQAWFGPVTWFKYQDDNWGSGVEANSLVELEHNGLYGTIRGSLRQSRTYELKNRLLVYGHRATAELRRNDTEKVYVHFDLHGKPIISAYQLPTPPNGRKDAFYAQLDNFVKAIRCVEKPRVDGETALKTIEVIEGCYREAQRLPEPWLELGEAAVEIAR